MTEQHAGQIVRRRRPKDFLAWAVEMFGPVALDREERLLRFVEEAVELAHAEGLSRVGLAKIVGRVYARNRGETPKEIGQVQATLECFAESIGLSADVLAQLEWSRVQTIPKEEWQRRHAAKAAVGITVL